MLSVGQLLPANAGYIYLFFKMRQY